MKILQVMPMPGSEEPYRLRTEKRLNATPVILGLVLVEDRDGDTSIEYLTMESYTSTLYITRGYFGGVDF